MAHDEVKHNGKVYFDVADLPKRTKVAVSTLTKLIRAIDEKVAPDAKYNRNRNEATDDLAVACERAFPNQQTNVYVYGSCINGFGSRTSDVDCFVLMARGNLQNVGSFFNPMLKELRRNPTFSLLHSIRKAKVPIITVKHRNGMEMDISFASSYDPKDDVLENSALLNSYAQSNPKVTAVGRFLKFVLSCEPVYGSAKMNGLSSYSHIIMFIYFLLHGRHKIKHVKTHRPADVVNNRINATEGDIFLDFLKFYACEFDSSKHAIDIRPEQVEKLVKGRSPVIWTIEDPIIEKNLGKTMSAKRCYDMKLFYYNLLVELSDHRMNEECLLGVIESGLEIKHIPAVNPLARPDKPDNKSKGKNGKGGNKAATAQDNNKASTSNASTSQSSRQPSDYKSITKTVALETITEAPSTTAKNAKKKNRKKQGTVSSEGDIVVINDASLDDMMGELSLGTPTKPAPALAAAVKATLGSAAKTLLESFTKLTVTPDWKVAHYSTVGQVCGDNRILLVVPILTALGLRTPGLYAENTRALERLKVLPGFRAELSFTEMENLLETVGCFIAYAKNPEENLAPVDTAWEVALTASAGVQFSLTDIACSEKGKAKASAKDARGYNNAYKELGIANRVHLSNARMPYSATFGYCLEVMEVLRTLEGEGHSELMGVVAQQCGTLLQMSGMVRTISDGEKQVYGVLSSGAALSKFYQLLSGQGVSEATISAIKEKKYADVLKMACEVTVIKSPYAGIVRECTTESVERVLRGLGGYGSSGNGLELLVELGGRVNHGTPLIRVHHTNPISSKLLTALNKMVVVEKVHMNRILQTFRNDNNNNKKPKPGGQHPKPDSQKPSQAADLDESKRTSSPKQTKPTSDKSEEMMKMNDAETGAENDAKTVTANKSEKMITDSERNEEAGDKKSETGEEGEEEEGPADFVVVTTADGDGRTVEEKEL